MTEFKQQTKEETISDFRSNSDKLVFSQPLVAEVIGAAQQDLNTWRSRGFINIGVQKNSRISYTGRGLIHAGIVNELAFFMDPKRAANFSNDLINTVTGFLEGHSFINMLEFHRPFGADGSPSPQGRELWMSLAPSVMKFEELQSNRAQLLIPLGNLMAQWAITAQMKLEPTI